MSGRIMSAHPPQEWSASIEVKVRHIHAAGPVARVELERIDTGKKLEAETAAAGGTGAALSVATRRCESAEARVFSTRPS